MSFIIEYHNSDFCVFSLLSWFSQRNGFFDADDAKNGEVMEPAGAAAAGGVAHGLKAPG